MCSFLLFSIGKKKILQRESQILFFFLLQRSSGLKRITKPIHLSTKSGSGAKKVTFLLVNTREDMQMRLQFF